MDKNEIVKYHELLCKNTTILKYSKIRLTDYIKDPKIQQLQIPEISTTTAVTNNGS